MNNGVNIRDLNGVEASTSQFPLIGYTVFWRLAGIRVNHPGLERALQEAGFDKYLPDPPTPRVALRRALAEWIKTKQRITRNLQLRQSGEEQGEHGGGRRRTLIRVIDRAGSDHLVYALVAEDVDFSALGLSYGTALRILLNKKTGEMICTTDAAGVIDAQRESQQLTDELMPYWRQYRDLFIARDLSQMVREIIGGMNAVSLRQAGGVYFVPESERDALFRLRQLRICFPVPGMSIGVTCSRTLTEQLVNALTDSWRSYRSPARGYYDLLNIEINDKVVDTSIQEDAMPSIPLIETSYQNNKVIIGLYGKEGYATKHGIWVNFFGQMIPVDHYSHFQAYLEVRQGRPVNPMSPWRHPGRSAEQVVRFHSRFAF